MATAGESQVVKASRLAVRVVITPRIVVFIAGASSRLNTGARYRIRYATPRTTIPRSKFKWLWSGRWLGQTGISARRWARIGRRARARPRRVLSAREDGRHGTARRQGGDRHGLGARHRAAGGVAAGPRRRRGGGERPRRRSGQGDDRPHREDGRPGGGLQRRRHRQGLR